jgi:hypothetical protein
MINLSFDLFLSITGTLFGIVGTLLAFFQWKKVKNVEKLRREQLSASINRAKFLIIPNEVIEKIIMNDDIESKETLRQWLWSLHKGASDNYVALVNYYLSLEESFTYKDLEYLKKAGVITTNWEENVWRSQIVFRPENRKKSEDISHFELDTQNYTVKRKKTDNC